MRPPRKRGGKVTIPFFPFSRTKRFNEAPAKTRGKVPLPGLPCITTITLQ